MKFINLPEDYAKIVEMLGNKLSLDAIEAEVKYSPSGDIVVSFDGKSGEIKCSKKHHFCRALTLFAMNYKKAGGAAFKKTEKEAFESLGCMIDLSFGTVLNLESLKELIDYMALWGFNQLFLYIEDLYTIPGRPFFGYMRGTCTYDEYKELDDYGYALGMELIPMMQTLGHLGSYLQWPEANGMKENGQVLEPQNDKTYEFVEEMIVNVSAPFRTDKIHIGCDETHGLGMGASFKKHGYREPLGLLVEHVNRAAEICKKHGLKPIIASDMYIAYSSKTYNNYDVNAVISDEIKALVNPEVELMYWHYGQFPGCDSPLIDKHVELNGRPPMFLGGIRIWHNPLPDNIFSALATQDSLPACKAKGVKEVALSVWCYAKTIYQTTLLELARYGEFCYNDTDEGTKDSFEFVTGASYDAFMMMSNLSYLYETDEQKAAASYWKDGLGEQFYNCDIMQNMLEKDMQEWALSGYHRRNAEWFKPLAEKNDPKWDFLYKYCYNLFDNMAVKFEIVENLRPAYDKGDKEMLKKIADELLVRYISSMERACELHMGYKDKYLKPFGEGWVESAYGRRLERARGAIRRINKYLSGELSRLAELEVEKLNHPFDAPVVFAR